MTCVDRRGPNAYTYKTMIPRTDPLKIFDCAKALIRPRLELALITACLTLAYGNDIYLVDLDINTFCWRIMA
ncbi:MAG: hypothetical protein VW268_05235 [Rhodospirillaceae bacterium]